VLTRRCPGSGWRTKGARRTGELYGGKAQRVAVARALAITPAGTPTPLPGHVYYATMGTGLAVALLVILATLPLLGCMTSPGSIRFEYRRRS
jgi:hypothetical protein